MLSIKNNLKAMLTNLIWVSIAGYFVYHIIIGARGIISWTVLSREANQLESDLAQLQTANYFLGNKVKRLKEDNLDLDLLEEQAEKVLGFCHPKDTVVLLPQEI